VVLIQTPNWHLALVFNRHSFHELGCSFVLRRFSPLVGHRTPLAEMAILRHLLARIVTVLNSRELGREKSETKQSTKWKAYGKTAKVNNKLSVPTFRFPLRLPGGDLPAAGPPRYAHLRVHPMPHLDCEQLDLQTIHGIADVVS